MSPSDSIDAREMLAEEFKVKAEVLSTLTADAISARARRLAKRNGGLGQHPDPYNPKKFLYSRKACRALWNNTKPLPIAA